ncbi:MAG: dTDP-4-dehydrorhamnose 3,5-epimerase [Hyphomicrobiales bacterium]|nr:dTDP-4-dehydrorhamnose 3,5-epimerase [Hyphomicrobiales bacterium]
MKTEATPLSGVTVVHLDVFGDERGFFTERFNVQKFEELALPTSFVQLNHSRSAPGVLRGLHYQATPPQGKLVGATRGRIWDVAVDIRPHSPTFGQHFGLELSDMNGLLLWIPAGFAHGFCVLGNGPADVLYLCTAMYNPQGESGIRYNDPDLSVAWPYDAMGANVIVSERDTKQPSFLTYRESPPPWETILT